MISVGEQCNFKKMRGSVSSIRPIKNISAAQYRMFGGAAADFRDRTTQFQKMRESVASIRPINFSCGAVQEYRGTPNDFRDRKAQFRKNARVCGRYPTNSEVFLRRSQMIPGRIHWFSVAEIFKFRKFRGSVASIRPIKNFPAAQYNDSGENPSISVTPIYKFQKLRGSVVRIRPISKIFRSTVK